MAFKRQEGNFKLKLMHRWLIFNHLLSRKFAFYTIMPKRLGGIHLTRDHSARHEKPNRLPRSEKWNANKRHEKTWPFIEAYIYVCIVILETLLLRKWMPKLAGYRGQFLNCFILIPSFQQVFLENCFVLIPQHSPPLFKNFSVTQFEAFQLDII